MCKAKVSAKTCYFYNNVERNPKANELSSELSSLKTKILSFLSRIYNIKFFKDIYYLKRSELEILK